MRSSSMRFASPFADAPSDWSSWDRGARIPTSSLPRLLRGRDFHSVLSRGWLPNHELRPIRPLCVTGKPSCDGSTAEFRIVDLITQHDVGANEQFSGSCDLGFSTATPLCQSLIETLQLLVFAHCYLRGFNQQIA